MIGSGMLLDINSMNETNTSELKTRLLEIQKTVRFSWSYWMYFLQSITSGSFHGAVFCALIKKLWVVSLLQKFELSLFCCTMNSALVTELWNDFLSWNSQSFSYRRTTRGLRISEQRAQLKIVDFENLFFRGVWSNITENDVWTGKVKSQVVVKIE